MPMGYDVGADTYDDIKKDKEETRARIRELKEKSEPTEEDIKEIQELEFYLKYHEKFQ